MTDQTSDPASSAIASSATANSATTTSAETTRSPLHAPLDEYVRQFDDLKRDVVHLTKGLSDHQLNWSPTAKRWSMAQCLDHLSAVAKPYALALEKGITKTKDQGFTAAGAVRYSWLERWMIRSMEPPPSFRMPAPGMFKPAESAKPLPGALVVAEYVALKDRFVDLLVSVDGLDIGRVKIPSPETRLLRLRIGAAFAFLASHERRHVWQARQVRGDAAFPS